MWGTALDHVLEVEVVTADGKIQRASKTENADLFWSLQGAGASFGVITEFVVRTEEEPGSVVEYTYSFSFNKQSEIAPPLGVLITGTLYGTLNEYKASGIPDKLPAASANFTMMDWLGSLAHIAEKTALYLANVPAKFISRSLALREEDLLSE
ncbi:FAD-linked oxidoreductase afoF [Beauveria bassiana]|nr:FAD-linked oxidoreductase afoF [Beauveria bassiana]KAH8719944.1 FAD-linked oxidoreductase sorD [Beauveria bassiana]